jgi:hypothetical protein
MGVLDKVQPEKGPSYALHRGIVDSKTDDTSIDGSSGTKSRSWVDPMRIKLSENWATWQC